MPNNSDVMMLKTSLIYLDKCFKIVFCFVAFIVTVLMLRIMLTIKKSTHLIFVTVFIYFRDAFQCIYHHRQLIQIEGTDIK